MEEDRKPGPGRPPGPAGSVQANKRQREATSEYRERRRERESCYDRIRIRKNTMEKWRELLQESTARNHSDFADILLTVYQEHSARNKGSRGKNKKECIPTLGSTPKTYKMRSIHDQGNLSSDAPSLPSSISGIHQADDSAGSAEEASPPASLPSPSPGSEHPSEPDSAPEIDISVSFIEKGDFIYPKEKPVDDSEDDDSDFDFDELVVGLIEDGPNCEDLEQKGEEEEVLGMEQEQDQEVEEETEEEESRGMPTTSKSGLHLKVKTQEAADAEFFLISHSRLAELAGQAASKCSTCGAPLTVSVTPGNGTAGHVTWKCPSGHRKGWCTQETLNGSHVGDLKMASAILLSGNNFTKVKLLCSFVPLKMVAQGTFAALQRKYIAPAIEDHWAQVQKSTHAKYKDVEVVACGDGRNDSPGHNAQYLTYTFIEHDTKDILHVGFMDKREANMKSNNMEPLAFKAGLDKMAEDGLTVKEVVTDAHSSIAKHMRDNRPTVFHSWDIWHGAKNLGKKLTKVSARAATKRLLYWVRHILVHFWFCARTCGGSSRTFKAKWHGLTHHVTNKHEWVAGLYGSNSCEHGPLPERVEWLSPGDGAHKALVQVAYEKKFINNLHYFTRFRHTSMLESIHNHILMYASKRYSFGYQAYRARNLLAMIDYMAHKDRPVKRDADGKMKKVATWSKHAGNYVPKFVKVPKTYPYIRDLMTSILARREADPSRLFSKAILLPNDPRHIRPRLAPFPPPSMEEISQRNMGRLSEAT